MKYILGSKVFANKNAIKTYFQDYYKENDVGTALEGEYKAVMTDLIRRHPTYDDTWSNEFTIGLDDWEHKCILGHSPAKNQKKNVQDSTRVAIESQIRAHKRKSRIGGIHQCAVCQKHFLKVNVDHNLTIITFQTLLDNFMIAQTKGYSDCGHNFNEADRKQWFDYHAQNASLRCLCRDLPQITYRVVIR
jgi:hypothetical protein